MTEQPELQPRRFAEWHERFLAYLVDVAPLVILFLVFAAFTDDSGSYMPIGTSFSSTGPTGESSGLNLMISGIPSVLYLVVMLSWFAYNWLIRQGSTGQTVGKKFMDIAVLDATHRPIGAGLTFARQLAHVLDFLPCFLGYLWPAWDKEKRTFADMILQTRVHAVGAGRL